MLHECDRILSFHSKSLVASTYNLPKQRIGNNISFLVCFQLLTFLLARQAGSYPPASINTHVSRYLKFTNNHNLDITNMVSNFSRHFHLNGHTFRAEKISGAESRTNLIWVLNGTNTMKNIRTVENKNYLSLYYKLSINVLIVR